MPRPDLDALIDLQALLAAGSVTGAAERLHLSVPAMSRRLARLRHQLGDPLFVAAGRGLVPTARALALAPRVERLVEEAGRLLAPERVDLATVRRTVVLRANDGFVGGWSAALSARVAAQAPHLVLRFVPRTSKDPEPLRRGDVDLDLGVPPEDDAPELLRAPLFEARFVAAFRVGHPLGKPRALDAARYAAWPHVEASRRTPGRGPLADALSAAGIAREVRVVVPGFQAALAVAAGSDLIATVPEPFVRWCAPAMRCHVATLPVRTPAVSVAMTWHPRNDAEPVQRWVRAQVALACG